MNMHLIITSEELEMITSEQHVVDIYIHVFSKQKQKPSMCSCKDETADRWNQNAQEFRTDELGSNLHKSCAICGYDAEIEKLLLSRKW